MKKTIIIIFILALSTLLFPANDANFILSLVDKPVATFNDAMISFCYLNNVPISDDFNKNIENLKNVIKHMPRKVSINKNLTYGDFSLLAMQHLNIKSGMLYMSSYSGRYAVRELAMINLIPFNTSEFQKMSGNDLIKYLEKVTEYENK